MALKQKNAGARYARRATRRASLRDRDPRRWKRMILCIVAAVAVITVALVWGNILKAESDARRAEEEAGEWLLDEQIATPIPVAVPSVGAGFAEPSQKMHPTLDMDYGAVTFDLGSCLAPLPYSLTLPAQSGMTVQADAPELASEVRRFKNAGYYVIGVFTVTSFDTADITERTFRRGLEMTLLSLFSQAGVDNILLMGLPVGSDTLDPAAMAYLSDVEQLFASIPASVPALGVALYPAAFVGDTVGEDGSLQYVGSLTPGRMLSVCDYLALDLRGMGDTAGDLLQEMQYACVRYSLRLLTSTATTEGTEALSHGFTNILEFGH